MYVQSKLSYPRASTFCQPSFSYPRAALLEPLPLLLALIVPAPFLRDHRTSRLGKTIAISHLVKVDLRIWSDTDIRRVMKILRSTRPIGLRLAMRIEVGLSEPHVETRVSHFISQRVIKSPVGAPQPTQT